MNTPAGWSKNDNVLYFAMKCSDFKHALAVLNSFADIAEKLQHHPDLGIRNYNEVFVASTTHEVNKVTEKDYALAREINDLLDYQSNKVQIETIGRKNLPQ
jgi:4a-hydroxytetrahydrobiopterin dehydratase